jgi:glutamine amidotransferase-like uncharacterized protein
MQVSFLSAEQLLSAEWARQPGGCDLLCMPGGADLPYCRLLNGRGNAIIRGWVEAGGAYLGICAGAYYASSCCVFEAGNPDLEVIGDRELAFFPGTAFGPVHPGFDYQSERGAAAVAVTFRPSPSANSSGGTTPTYTITTLDYTNGGPMFLSCEGGKDLLRDGLWEGRVEVLAEYGGRPGGPHAAGGVAVGASGAAAAAAAVRCVVGGGVAVLCGTHPELNPSYLREYRDLLLRQQREEEEQQEQGRGPGQEGPGGEGGSEEEEGGASPAAAAEGAEKGLREQAAHVDRLASELERHEAGRRALWHLLLRACLEHKAANHPIDLDIALPTQRVMGDFLAPAV